jgi:hypothetical protein
MSRFGVVTGPWAIKDRADERIRCGTFIVKA